MRRRDGLAQRSATTDLHPGDVVDFALWGHDHHRGAESLRLADPTVQSVDGTKFTGQAHFAQGGERAGYAEVQGRRRHREREGDVDTRMIAKKRSALVALQDQLRQRETGKTYAALVAGAWPAARKVIDVALHKFLTAEGERRVQAVADDAIEAKRSITLVRVAQRLDGYTLLDVTIKTGRTHQIRVHLTHEGHAIVGDEKYGDFALNKSLARGDAVRGVRFDRMFLHAKQLRFTHPGTGGVIELAAPLPAECEALIHALAARPAPP